MNRTLFRNAAFATLIALASAAAPAIAQSGQDDAPRVVIHTDGIDLASPEGQKQLHARIKHAARSVCGDSYIRDLHANMLQRLCVSKALASANTQITALSERNRLAGEKLAAVDLADRYPGRPHR